MVTAHGDRLPVLFLWHHHQPFYRAPGAERPKLPWVRLHAARGYLDMMAVTRDSGCAMTFNFSPSLLHQLREAAESEICDEFERVSLLPAHEWREEEKRFVLRHFFSIHWAVHVKGHPRYEALLAKRGDMSADPHFRSALVDYTAQDFTDLVALFNLTWIGFTGRHDSQIADLVKKVRDYSADDIRAILAFHHRALRDVLSGYRALRERGQIEISVSPYSHAILPLLCDTSVAAPDIPRQRLPRPEYRRPDDAERQIKLALDAHRETWGETPSGLWPSEGSVSEEVLNLAAGSGFRWAVTDQGILERSERTRTETPPHFLSYHWKSGKADLRIYFRDHALSDAIGFRYAGMNGKNAAADFTGHLERISDSTKGVGGRCVVVALDGENPWESYADGGENFLTSLLNTVRKHPKLATQTFSDHLKSGSRERISGLHAGSWIDSNFRVWIGDPEKNQAWTELGRARHMLDELSAGDPRRDECWKWLLKAQCSDWFWWYGEPFNSMYESEFDELFRGYLKALYSTAGREPPPALDVPISLPPRPERRLQPTFPMSPTIDGRDTFFYEWIGACHVDPRQWGTAMGRTEHIIRRLYYGFGADEVFLRFDPADTLHPQSATVLRLHVLGDQQTTLEIPLGHSQAIQEREGIRWAFQDIIEVAVRRDHIELPRGGECQFWLELTDGSMVLEKIPPAGALRFVVPTVEMVAANWIV
jgi:alpha-amylase/alpha-mannosidase (GH57 family)